jgi:hypothetical protein
MLALPPDSFSCPLPDFSSARSPVSTVLAAIKISTLLEMK